MKFTSFAIYAITILLKIKTTSLGRGAGSEATASRTGGLLMLLI